MPDFRLPELPDSSRELLERVVQPPNRPPLLYLAMAANAEMLRQYVRVHVAFFGKTSILTPSQVEATVIDAQPSPAWTSRQSAIIALADAVADARALTNEQQRQVDDALDDAERVEILAVASLYLGISATCNVLGIPTEL
jgi:4-carboxymuconolactone decarboxylase